MRAEIDRESRALPWRLRIFSRGTRIFLDYSYNREVLEKLARDKGVSDDHIFVIGV
jgi:hypothetical protein